MQLMIGTRKGLFVLSHQAGGLKINQTAFVGEPVLQTLVDVRDGAAVRLMFDVDVHEKGGYER